MRYFKKQINLVFFSDVTSDKVGFVWPLVVK